jgi:hypothetical protein
MNKRVKKPTAPDGFPQKLWDKLSTSWRDGALTKQTEELKSDLFESEKLIAQTENDMDADEKLTALKNEIKALKEDEKDLSGGYKDVITGEQAKIKYCLYLMESRGGL